MLYLAVQLVAAFLPPPAFAPLAAVFVLALAVVWRFPGKYRPHLLLCCAVPAAALTLRMAALVWLVAPVQARAGTQAEIHAAVLETAPGLWEDVVRATARVDMVDGKAVRPFRVYFQALPDAQPGECFTARVRWEALENDAYRNSHYADGVFLQGEVEEAFCPAGESTALWARAARLRAGLGRRLYAGMPRAYAGMAVAMTTGDRRFLDDALRDTLRRAGLAHVIVVSGLHLSALSGLVFMALRRRIGRKCAAAGAMIAVLGFQLLTGFTPSVTRAGVAMLLLYGGMLLERRSDGVTSLGAAALLLCLQNPYAAVDTGLLLSFSATLGVLAAAEARAGWYAEHEYPASWLRHRLQSFFWTVLGCAFACAATLPVLIAMGGGVSLLSVASNLLVVPVLPFAVGSGLAALGAGLPGLGFLRGAAGFLTALLLRWITGVAEWAASVPYAFVHISGMFALCVTALFLVLVWAAWRLRPPPAQAAALCLSFLLVCGAAYAAADARVVRIVTAGRGANPPIVILQGLKTAVIFRGPDANVSAVREVLEQYNRTGVELLLDLRPDGAPEQAAQALNARETVCVQRELVNNGVYAPFGDVVLYVRRQAQGNFVCVEVRGCRVGVASGSVELSDYPPLDVFIAGTGRPKGLFCGQMIVPHPGSYRWLKEISDIRLYGRAEIRLRAGASVMICEEWYGFE